MSPHLRELLTDLKAAVLIGHPDSVQTALDGIRTLDDDQLPPSALLSLGRALTPLPAKTLTSFLDDPDPAIRALAGVAMGERYMQDKDATIKDLTTPATDPNPEVRAALAQALIESAPPQPDKLTPLIQSWLVPPRVQKEADRGSGTRPDYKLRSIHPALLLLAYHPSSPSVVVQPHPLFPLLFPLDSLEDHDLRESLVHSLNTLAEKGNTVLVLDLLSRWASRSEPNIWVITRVLSATWAQAHHEQATRILNTLARQAGMIRPILRTLERHRDR